MKISVVIPAYNEEKNIAATIEAVLLQNYPDFEVIVVDNASTDNTIKAAQAAAAFYTQKIPVKFVTEPKKGTSAARERGRRESTGDIIATIDADCLPNTDYLSKAAALFENPKIVAASGPYDYYDGSPIFRAVSLWIQKHIYGPVNAALQIFRAGGTMTGGNSVFRASTLQEIEGFNIDIVFYGDDTDAARRLAKYGRIAYSPELTMKTSARRFKTEGTFFIFTKYLFFFFKELAK